MWVFDFLLWQFLSHLRQKRLVGVYVGDGSYEGLGVGLGRMLEHRRRRSLLDNASPMHDDDPVAQVAHDREIVSNEQQGQVHLALQCVKQVEYLRLDGHIQRCGAFIGNDQSRLDRQSPRNAGTLALPTAHAARPTAGELPAEIDEIEQFTDALGNIPPLRPS